MENCTSEIGKVCKHNPRARFLKEEDELWISSEDLNTEDSSDEESGLKYKRKNKKQLKQNKHKSSTYLEKLNRLSSTGLISSQSTCPITIDKNAQPSQKRSLHEDLSKLDIEPYILQPSTSKVQSTGDENLELPHLESWRPVRGSLQFESINLPDDTTGKKEIIQQAEGFFDGMVQKIHDLKSNVQEIAEKVMTKDEKSLKTFKHLKNIPEVKATLEFIQKMDEDIASTISLYKAERAERLQSQEEMCNELNENKINIEKNTETFLQLCDFEASAELISGDDVESDQLVAQQQIQEEIIRENLSNGDQIEKYRQYITENTDLKHSVAEKNFVKRNIQVAKEGIMASCSLTDEEKYKLEKLLSDDPSEPQAACSVDIWSKYREERDVYNEDDNNDEGDNLNEQMIEAIMSDTNANAFTLNALQKRRMEEIDCSLKTYSDSSNPADESSPATNIAIKDDKFWKLYIMAEGLKEIDQKLLLLEQQYEEEQLKLGRKTRRIVQINGNSDESDMEEQNDDEVLGDTIYDNDIGMTSSSSVTAVE